MPTTTTLPRIRRVAVVVALATSSGAWQMAVPGPPAAAQPAPDPAPSAEVDVLRAEASDVRAQMEATAARRAEAEATLASARAAADAAQAQVAVAQRAENRARRRSESLDRQVRRVAVSAYVRREHESPLGVLMAASSQEAAWRSTVLQSRADQLSALRDEQRAAQRRLETQRSALAEAASAAAIAEQQAEGQVGILVDVEQRQVRLAAQVDRRLDAKLAEAAALAAIDAAAADRLAADEQGLAQAVAMTVTPPSGVTTTRRPTPVVVSGPPAAAAPPTTRAPSTPPPASPPATTSPPVTVPVPTITPVDTVTVGGFVVDRSIGGQVGSMLDAARAAGLVLGGSAYRDVNTQIELRRKHCGPSDWEVWFKPSSQCSPPTAVPGRSMHEKGLALDFTCAGVLIGTRDNPCFVWLAANAASFGFKNLPSEPWHWSTNGN